MCRTLAVVMFAFTVAIGSNHAESAADSNMPSVLKPANYQHFIDTFNAEDWELFSAAFPDTTAWPFLRDNIPLFDCPDQSLEEIYYFRWWTYLKHIKQTPDGFIITEFLPDVPWAGKDNSINCAAALHFYEGRWLHNPKFLDDYAVFWLRKGGSLRSYSFWIADALWNRYLVTGDPREAKELLSDLVANYLAWEQTHLSPEGLFWQIDDRDGMEMSVGGSGCRPSINSYMFADAQAIANIANLIGLADVKAEYRAKAAKLKQLVQEKLWNADQHFFETLPDRSNAKLVGVREEIGYTPWYVNLPDASYADAWNQIVDTNGFYAPYGPTTVERRSPGFKVLYRGHECQWNGPSWPYATSITLTAMANLLDHYRQQIVNREDYMKLLEIYVKSQHITVGPWYQRHAPTGAVIPWIDENMNPLTGDWIAHTRLLEMHQAPFLRGKDYNHSTFCDLIITGLVGLRPRLDNTVEVNPLLPDRLWDWFCLDNVAYHGHILTILYDKSGKHYHQGKGLRLLADGKIIAVSANVKRLTGELPKNRSSLQ